MVRVSNGMLLWDTFDEVLRAMFDPMTAELERKLLGRTNEPEESYIWSDSWDEESDGWDED